MEFADALDAAHLRMARSGLDLTIRELAYLSNVNKATIVRIEAGHPVREATLLSVRETLESKGAQFYMCCESRRIFVSLDANRVPD